MAINDTDIKEHFAMKEHILSLINDDKTFFPIVEEAFNAVDLDKNGFIDKDEFKICANQVAKGFGLEDPTELAIEDVYNKLDADKNGTIDIDEFKKYVREIMYKILEEM